MNAQVSVITLGVMDLERAKRFYGEGLGCPIRFEQDEFASFDMGDGSSGLALYTREGLAEDAGVAADGRGFRAFTLSYVVPSPERVDEVLSAAESAGAEILKAAEHAAWGGYFGYFSDPDGNLWKVVTAPPPAS
jgi:uncharacterized protein